MNDEFNDAYNYLIENRFFTEDELQLVTDINGSNIDVLNDCIYCRYGFRDIEQLKDEYKY